MSSSIDDADDEIFAKYEDEIYMLKIALHDAIKSPKGVVPKSAERFYDAWRFYGNYQIRSRNEQTEEN